MLLPLLRGGGPGMRWPRLNGSRGWWRRGGGGGGSGGHRPSAHPWSRWDHGGAAAAAAGVGDRVLRVTMGRCRYAPRCRWAAEGADEYCTRVGRWAAAATGQGAFPRRQQQQHSSCHILPHKGGRPRPASLSTLGVEPSSAASPKHKAPPAGAIQQARARLRQANGAATQYALPPAACGRHAQCRGPHGVLKHENPCAPCISMHRMHLGSCCMHARGAACPCCLLCAAVQRPAFFRIHWASCCARCSITATRCGSDSSRWELKCWRTWWR